MSTSTKRRIRDLTNHKVDMGIALCHFDLTAKEEGIKGEFIVKVPGITVQNDIEYIISYVMEN